jgi:hypothetical protein
MIQNRICKQTNENTLADSTQTLFKSFFKELRCQKGAE